MAFQTNAFQNNAFQVAASKIRRREDYVEQFTKRPEESDERTRRLRHQRRLEIAAEEAFQKKLEQLEREELEMIEMLIALLLIEESESK